MDQVCPEGRTWFKGTVFIPCPDRLKARRSGFELERRGKEAKCSFRREAETERSGFRPDDDGPLVKWLRQRPLTPLTSVRIRYGSPLFLLTRRVEKFIIQFVLRLLPDNIEFVPSSEVNQRSVCRGERGVTERASSRRSRERVIRSLRRASWCRLGRGSTRSHSEHGS